MEFNNRSHLHELGKLIDNSEGRFKRSPQKPYILDGNATSSNQEVYEPNRSKNRTFKTLQMLQKKQEQHGEVWPLLRAVESNYLDTNGWIPVSRETIYDQIKRESAQVHSYVASHNIQAINTDINKVLSPQNKWIGEENIDDESTYVKKHETKCVTKDGVNCQNEKFLQDEVVDPDYNYVSNVFHNSSIQNNTVDKTARRSKKMANVSFNDHIQQLLLNEDKLTAKEKIYKVTEESELDDIIGQENSQTNESGYKYDPPKKQNHTNELFEILTKYRIRKDDKLPNYALSRRQKAQVPLKQGVSGKRFQNRLFSKYNNINHLPVDPLLAVFLSNYGYYLQGMYGINNHYNNLYGYLASNNIHNNRPFGFYKVFSDTDSSH